MAKKATKKPRNARLHDVETGEEAADMGQDQPVIPALTKALEAYMQGRDERMEAGRQEAELKGKVLDLMHHHGLTTYTDHDADLTASIVPEKEKVKAKRISKPESDESDE